MRFSAPLGDSKTNNDSETPNCHQNLEMISLNTGHQFMITNTTTQLLTSPQPSANLQWNQIHMSGLYKSRRQFTITTQDKFQYQ